MGKRIALRLDAYCASDRTIECRGSRGIYPVAMTRRVSSAVSPLVDVGDRAHFQPSMDSDECWLDIERTTGLDEA